MENNELRRIDLMDIIVSGMKDWDGSAESAMDILNVNQPYFEELQSMENASKKADQENERKTWQSLIDQHVQMREAIQMEHKKLVNQMQQLNKKDKVVEHYMTDKRPSIFVDKDM